ncbi:MAG: META domain-containing protein [Bacteroidota bacterium]|nr:META domain-containing protein [Bacteroidota bacterium]
MITKTENSVNVPLQDTYWKLTELMGQPIKSSGNETRQAFLKFDNVQKRISGNSGCNSFGGSYHLQDTAYISFGPLLSTKMYCNDVPYESLFFDVLSKCDNYNITSNTLVLRNGKMDSTVKFVADTITK